MNFTCFQKANKLFKDKDFLSWEYPKECDTMSEDSSKRGIQMFWGVMAFPEPTTPLSYKIWYICLKKQSLKLYLETVVNCLSLMTKYLTNFVSMNNSDYYRAL